MSTTQPVLPAAARGAILMRRLEMQLPLTIRRIATTAALLRFACAGDERPAARVSHLDQLPPLTHSNIADQHRLISGLVSGHA
jgi:hypothetical protein